MKTDIKKVMDAANWMYPKQGYVDIILVATMVSLPQVIIAKILELNGFSVTSNKYQYVRKSSKNL